MNQKGFDWAEPVPTVSAAASSANSFAPPVLSQWPPAMAGLDDAWCDELVAFFASPAGQALDARLRDALARGERVYPPEPLRALALTPLAQVRVVILGQDPYHGPGQAEGLAFSVAEGVKLPPSLRNIFKELQRSLGMPMPTNGSLVRWAQQGVLLINTCLTVQAGQAASHARWGWEALTDRLIARVAAQPHPVVFMLWGAHAQAKRGLIEQAAPAGQHLVLQANHPSPLSALRAPLPFLGCDHFLLAQRFLQDRGQKTIDW